MVDGHIIHSNPLPRVTGLFNNPSHLRREGSHETDLAAVVFGWEPGHQAEEGEGWIDCNNGTRISTRGTN